MTLTRKKKRESNNKILVRLAIKLVTHKSTNLNNYEQRQKYKIQNSLQIVEKKSSQNNTTKGKLGICVASISCNYNCYSTCKERKKKKHRIWRLLIKKIKEEEMIFA